jgi:exopolysaccharide biosynthesis polyprenyl glycosylphosphotransferase
MLAAELQRQKALFAATDAAALIAAFAAALMLHDPSNAMETRLLQTNPPQLALTVLAVVGLWLLVFRACDLYRMRNGGLKESLAIIRGCSFATLLTVLGGFLLHLFLSRISVVIAYWLSMLAVFCGRILTRALIRSLYTNPKNAIPLVLVGFNRFSRYLCDHLLDEMTPYEVVGFVDEQTAGRQYRGCPVLGGLDPINEMARIYPSLEVAIVMPDAPREQQEQIFQFCEEHRIRWWLLPWVSSWPVGGLSVETFGAMPLISPRGSNIEGLNFALKRAFDITAGSLILIVASPFLLAAALAIRLLDGAPVLYRQSRVGMHGKLFEMLKLRTMRMSAGDASHREYVRKWIGNGVKASQGGANGEQVFKLTDDQRITRLGRTLRRFSIDELPQLFNVIRGDMSLIGPRPALPYELELYKPWHLGRLDAIPGITGLWQVSGRNHLSFDEMVRLDVKYMQEWTLAGDLRILARTVPAMLRGSGV